MASRLKDRHKKSNSRAARRKAKSKATRRLSSRKKAVPPGTPQCGLCGATENLIKTVCCDQWICDDEANYVLFSYARNSCHRNHLRYTLCGFHYTEGHAGHWKDCDQCRKNMETEMYAHYGTNEYNFDVLENPPDYEPTKCSACGAVIRLADGGYSVSSEGYLCYDCTVAEHPDLYS